MDKIAKESQNDQPDKKPVAVRSAKDAINAMYADKQKSGLGDYLAMSAREIVNATEPKKNSGAKSAANLHKHARNRRVESVRTSASALLRNVGPKKIESKAPTVVRTSLKLKPKKPTVKLPVQSSTRPSTGLRAPKQPTLLSQVHTHNPQVFQDVVRVGEPAQKSAKADGPQATKRPTGTRLDGVRPVKTQASPADVKLKKPQPVERDEVKKPTLRTGTGRTHTKSNPLDSIKKKFAPAPKGFAADNARDARPNRPYQVEDYLNPSHATKSVPATDNATHYYGLSEEELAGNAKGVQVNRDKMAAEAGLGMVEDYDSGTKKPDNKSTTVLRRDSPDNNKYALSAQSPYYLKPEKEMKKRPLSGNGAVRPQTEAATSVNAGQDLSEEVSKKNQYKKKPKKAKNAEKSKKSSKPHKSAPVHDINQPTMIIPAHSRSNAPLVALLLLTVILGAIVGALAYLFFFQ